MIDKNTSIEEINDLIPESVSYLMSKGIKCIICGESIWGTLNEICQSKGFSDLEIENIVIELNNLKKWSKS